MEDHDRSAQEQRTRHEKRIAQLELNLQALKNENRYVTRLNCGQIHHSALSNSRTPTAPKNPRKSAPTVKFHDQQTMRRSKTMTSFLPSNKFATTRDYDTEDSDFKKMRDLERKYYECTQTDNGYESFYQWLMTDTENSRRSTIPPRCKQSDPHYYEKNVRYQCGRESRGSRHPQCDPQSRVIKHRRMESKDPVKRY